VACRRAGCAIKLLGKNNYDLSAFGFSLGMSSQQVKESSID
jgi:hypothetical protein